MFKVFPAHRAVKEAVPVAASLYIVGMAGEHLANGQILG